MKNTVFNTIKKVTELSVSISSEKDSDKLMLNVVRTMMDITDADGGTLYIPDGDKLDFKVIITKSQNTELVRKDEPLRFPPVSINGKNACAASAREKKLINIPDCYQESRYDFSGTMEYDKKNGYHTSSVLVIPMLDEYDDVIGVLQLINSVDSTGKIIPFCKTYESVLLAIANQAGMAIVNASYSQKINDLLYGFIKVMSVGIDERTPYNANHTRNMVKFADKFFNYESSCSGKYAVDAKKRREILMSIWLHDIGKILTPIDIMNKDSRLGKMGQEVENRFERRDLLLRLELAEDKISRDDYDLLEATRKSQLDFIRQINTVGFLSDELKAQLDELRTKTYRELDGSSRPVITDEEHYALSIVKGTLTKEERTVMQDHVVLTQKFLSQLDFPKYYDNIPVYAGNHHEFLDGSGYPNRLTADELPWPCRLITVCDIFEALIAQDRPYKKPMPVEKALFILHDMAAKGQLDAELVDEFEKSAAWLEKE